MNDRYCFKTEWFDKHAEMVREYEFFYYPLDSSVEMVINPLDKQYDVKQKRTFLKRTKSNLQLADLFIGANVNVQSRQLLIKDYADEYTRKNLVFQMERFTGFLI
jgi:nucleoside-diphosphate kinase